LSILFYFFADSEFHVADGDSGSWVVRDGKVCGYIFSRVVDSMLAYMLPIGPVLEDIRKTFGFKNSDSIDVPSSSRIHELYREATSQNSPAMVSPATDTSKRAEHGGERAWQSDKINRQLLSPELPLYKPKDAVNSMKIPVNTRMSSKYARNSTCDGAHEGSNLIGSIIDSSSKKLLESMDQSESSVKLTEMKDPLVDSSFRNEFSTQSAQIPHKYEDYPDGWPKVAAFLHEQKSSEIFRRFCHIRTRLLLSHMVNITELEKQLLDLDKSNEEGGEASQSRLRNRNPKNGLDMTKADLLQRLEKELLEYGIETSNLLSFDDMLTTNTDNLLLSHSKFNSLRRAQPRDIHSTFEWMWTKNPLNQWEFDWLFHQDDFVSLAATPVNNRLEIIIQCYLETGLKSIFQVRL